MAFYYLALREAKQMAEVLGNEEHIDWYDTRMATMKPAYEKAFWKDGFYSSNSEKFKDDRANAIAIVSGIANPDYYNQIVDNVLIPNRFSSPHFEWMVEEAIFIAGRPKASLQRMKEQYQSQVDDSSLTTLYEKFQNKGTYNHAWNGSNTILSKYVAGVKPTKVAWSEFAIMPELVDFKSIQKSIPTIKGTINIDINKTDSIYQLQLVSPENTTAIIGIPKSGKEIKEVIVNGEKVWTKGENKASVIGFAYETEDEKFLKFKAQSGHWKLEASYN
jgi:hypothetical protein